MNSNLKTSRIGGMRRAGSTDPPPCPSAVLTRGDLGSPLFLAGRCMCVVSRYLSSLALFMVLVTGARAGVNDRCGWDQYLDPQIERCLKCGQFCLQYPRDPFEECQRKCPDYISSIFKTTMLETSTTRPAYLSISTTTTFQPHTTSQQNSNTMNTLKVVLGILVPVIIIISFALVMLVAYRYKDRFMRCYRRRKNLPQKPVVPPEQADVYLSLMNEDSPPTSMTSHPDDHGQHGSPVNNIHSSTSNGHVVQASSGQRYPNKCFNPPSSNGCVIAPPAQEPPSDQSSSVMQPSSDAHSDTCKEVMQATENDGGLLVTQKTGPCEDIHHIGVNREGNPPPTSSTALNSQDTQIKHL